MGQIGNFSNVPFNHVAGFRPLILAVPSNRYNERVDHALQKLLASKTWAAPHSDWLKRIAAQTKANLLVDREALDDPDLVFKRKGGVNSSAVSKIPPTPIFKGWLTPPVVSPDSTLQANPVVSFEDDSLPSTSPVPPLKKGGLGGIKKMVLPTMRRSHEQTTSRLNIHSNRFIYY